MASPTVEWNDTDKCKITTTIDKNERVITTSRLEEKYIGSIYDYCETSMKEENANQDWYGKKGDWRSNLLFVANCTAFASLFFWKKHSWKTALPHLNNLYGVQVLGRIVTDLEGRIRKEPRKPAYHLDKWFNYTAVAWDAAYISSRILVRNTPKHLYLHSSVFGNIYGINMLSKIGFICIGVLWIGWEAYAYRGHDIWKITKTTTEDEPDFKRSHSIISQNFHYKPHGYGMDMDEKEKKM